MSIASGPRSVPAFAPASDDATAGRATPAYLAERARAGDTAAFEALVELRLGPAFRIALAIVGNEADARDAIQDAFVAAWRGLPGLRDADRFDAWLQRILVNRCRGLLRQRRRTAVREIQLDALGEVDEPTSEEGAIPERAASLDAVERAWFRLGADERAILALHHLEPRPLAVIAEVLAIPEGTAKSRLFTARRSLEKALEAELR